MNKLGRIKSWYINPDDNRPISTTHNILFVDEDQNYFARNDSVESDEYDFHVESGTFELNGETYNARFTDIYGRTNYAQLNLNNNSIEKGPRYLKLPDASQGGFLALIAVDSILSMETPTDDTVVDSDTGEVYNIDVDKHTLVYTKTNGEERNEFYIPLTLKEMILLVNSDARYTE
ncbi:MAG: hypothetical protein ACI31F_03045 [Muribaculaceae bacterium]